MLSEGKKPFPKASHLGVHIIYTLYIFAKTLWCFVWFLHISTASLSFFIYISFSTYILAIFSILCSEHPKVVKEMSFSIGSNKNHPYKLINDLLDLPLQLENS